MKCLFCQAEMKKSTVPFHIDRKGIHVGFDEIPAWVCPQCGESYFGEEEVDFVQALIKAVEEKAQGFSKNHSGGGEAEQIAQPDAHSVPAG